jgi:hypothetical protein
VAIGEARIDFRKEDNDERDRRPLIRARRTLTFVVYVRCVRDHERHGDERSQTPLTLLAVYETRSRTVSRLHVISRDIDATEIGDQNK